MTAHSPDRVPRRRGRLAAGVLLAGLALILATVVGVGFLQSAPAPATVGSAPAELHAEAVSIASKSGSTLAGWFLAGRPGGGAVVLLHGVRGNRLTMVRRARLLNEAGFSVLLFDFQAHGESAGARITFGRLEGRDAHAAVAFVRVRLPGERVGAIGSSLGGAAALLGPAPLPIDALVLESVYSDITMAISNRTRVVLGQTVGGVVGRPIAGLFTLILPPILGLDPADLRPIDRIAEVTAPLLIVQGTRDNRTTLAEARAMFERAREPKLFWAVDGAGHVDVEAFAPDEYRRRVLGFLVERLQRAP